MFSGLVGIPLGMVLSTSLKKYPRADPIICGVGMLVSSPFLGASLMFANNNITVCLILMFFGFLGLYLQWSILTDMVMYIVIPTLRGTAGAVQFFIASAFGDAAATYLIGFITDTLKAYFKKSRANANCIVLQILRDKVDWSKFVFPFSSYSSDQNYEEIEDQNNQDKCISDPEIYFKSYQLTLLPIAVVIQIIGAVFYFITAVYIVRDQVYEEVPDGDDKSQMEKYKESNEDNDYDNEKLK